VPCGANLLDQHTVSNEMCAEGGRWQREHVRPEGLLRGNAEKEQASDGLGTWQGKPEASGRGVVCRGTRGGLEGPEACRGLCQVS
jgi:hypothetical protein